MNGLCAHFKLHWSSTVIFTASVVPANRCRLQSIFSFCALRHRKPSVAFSSLWSILLQWNTRWRKVIVHLTQSAHSYCTREASFYLLCKCDISTPLLMRRTKSICFEIKFIGLTKKKSFTSLQRTRLQMKIPLLYKKLVITIFDATRTSIIAIKSRQHIKLCVTIILSNIFLLLRTDNATVSYSCHVWHLEITAIVFM